MRVFETFTHYCPAANPTSLVCIVSTKFISPCVNVLDPTLSVFVGKFKVAAEVHSSENAQVIEETSRSRKTDWCEPVDDQAT